MKDRVYIPLEDMARFGYTEESLFARRFTPEFAALMKFEVERTHALFAEGLKLTTLVEKRVRLDIEMFNRGGMEVLRRIEQQDYDTLTTRPAVPKSRQVALLIGRLLANLTAKVQRTSDMSRTSHARASRRILSPLRNGRENAGPKLLFLLRDAAAGAEGRHVRYLRLLPLQRRCLR